MADLARRYAHLKTPPPVTNPAHLEPTTASGGPTLPLAAKYQGGRPRKGVAS